MRVFQMDSKNLLKGREEKRKEKNRIEKKGIEESVSRRRFFFTRACNLYEKMPVFYAK